MSRHGRPVERAWTEDGMICSVGAYIAYRIGTYRTYSYTQGLSPPMFIAQNTVLSWFSHFLVILSPCLRALSKFLLEKSFAKNQGLGPAMCVRAPDYVPLRGALFADKSCGPPAGRAKKSRVASRARAQEVPLDVAR